MGCRLPRMICWWPVQASQTELQVVREELQSSQNKLWVAQEELRASRDELHNKAALLDKAHPEATEAVSSAERLTDECHVFQWDL